MNQHFKFLQHLKLLVLECFLMDTLSPLTTDQWETQDIQT